MKNPFTIALLSMLALPSVARAADGKGIFLSQGCDKCHSISAEGVAVAPPEPGEEPRGKVIDLSGASTSGDAAFFKGYLTKTVGGKDGKKHPRKFKGADAELATLADWLAGLKTPAK